MSVFVYRSQIGQQGPSERPGLRQVLPGGETVEAAIPPAGNGGALPGHQGPGPEPYDPLGHYNSNR